MLVLAPSPSSLLVPATLLFLFFPVMLLVKRTFLLPHCLMLPSPAVSRALNHRPLSPSTPLEHISEMGGGVSLFIKPSL